MQRLILHLVAEYFKTGDMTDSSKPLCQPYPNSPLSLLARSFLTFTPMPTRPLYLLVNPIRRWRLFSPKHLQREGMKSNV